MHFKIGALPVTTHVNKFCTLAEKLRIRLKILRFYSSRSTWTILFEKHFFYQHITLFYMLFFTLQLKKKEIVLLSYLMSWSFSLEKLVFWLTYFLFSESTLKNNMKNIKKNLVVFEITTLLCHNHNLPPLINKFVSFIYTPPTHRP